jgi:uncharacterized membrane protein YjgN (DUF898 family)
MVTRRRPAAIGEVLLAKRKIPIVVGNLVEVIGILFAMYLIQIVPQVTLLPLKLILYLVAWGCMEFFPHSLSHYVVGSFVGVRFRYYSVGRSSAYKLAMPLLRTAASKLPVLTLKVDRASLQSAGRGGRIAMFSSGAVASMLFPFAVAYASLRDLPFMLTGLLFFFSAANFMFDLYFSPKVGDIARAIDAGK